MTQQLPVWVDGVLAHGANARVAALDHAVIVGDAAFETLKVVDGTPFALTRHLERINATLTGMGLTTADEDMLRRGTEQVLAAAELPLGRLRWTVSSGPGALSSERPDSALTHIVSAGPIAAPPISTALLTVPWTRNERAASAGLKTTSYADNVIALARASAAGAGEAIFGNTRDELCEGTGSNVFLVRDGQVVTPPLSSGCLAGITRALTIHWAGEAGIPVQEVDVPLADAPASDEVFITSSTRDIMAVHRWDDVTYDAPGPVTSKLSSLFQQRAAIEVNP